MSMRIQAMFLLLAVSISQAHFCEEIVVVKEGIKFAVYNAEGKKIALSFDEPEIYQNGFVVVKEGIKFVVYDAEGKRIVLSFDEPEIYQNGFVVVKEGIRQAVYNADGKKITSSFGEPAINSKKAQLSRTCDEQDYKFHKQKQHYNRKIR